jgi:hypothetical protein
MSTGSDQTVPTPTLADLSPDAICALGMRPFLMTGFLVGTLRQHFASAAHIEDPLFRDLAWRPGEGDVAPPMPSPYDLLWSPADPTGIVVESITRWKPDASGQRPAVVVRRNDFQSIKLGIGNQKQGYYTADSGEMYEKGMRGSHTLFCLEGEAGGAERLAAEVWRDVLQFGQLYRVNLKLWQFEAAEFGALHRVEEAAGSYAVPITVTYTYSEAWTLWPNAPIIKKIDLVPFMGSCV